MPYRSNVFAQGHYYHVFNRGAGKHRIYFNPTDYEHCIRLVKRYSSRYGISMIAYCLMPNHYHFLLRQDTDVPLSKFINVLFNAFPLTRGMISLPTDPFLVEAVAAKDEGLIYTILDLIDVLYPEDVTG